MADENEAKDRMPPGPPPAPRVVEPGSPLDEAQFTYVRSSGPGGQNVNKVASKAVLRWNLEQSTRISDEVRARFRTLYPTRITATGDVVITGDRFRDRLKNRDDCLEKLGELIAAASVRPKRRRPTKPHRGAVEARLREKRSVSARKQGRRGSSDE
jgi:ribosome-associated protein